jgi:hypothetical protein
MNLNVNPMFEVNKKATHILFKQMGVVDTIRFLNQFSLGSGNYTEERKQWLDNLTIEDIVSDIKAQRNNIA